MKFLIILVCLALVEFKPSAGALPKSLNSELPPALRALCGGSGTTTPSPLLPTIPPMQTQIINVPAVTAPSVLAATTAAAAGMAATTAPAAAGGATTAAAGGAAGATTAPSGTK